jgi:hypothetical protein
MGDTEAQSQFVDDSDTAVTSTETAMPTAASTPETEGGSG